MAWHMGHPLSQTLFTSIYLDKLLWPVPKSFDEYTFHRGDTQAQPNNGQQQPMIHIVLRAYCLGLVKACDLALRRITQEYYYEVGINVFSLEERVFLMLLRKRILSLSSTIAVCSVNLILSLCRKFSRPPWSIYKSSERME